MNLHPTFPDFYIPPAEVEKVMTMLQKTSLHLLGEPDKLLCFPQKQKTEAPAEKKVVLNVISPWDIQCGSMWYDYIAPFHSKLFLLHVSFTQPHAFTLCFCLRLRAF